MFYTVKKGDTLYKIAKNHGITLQRLIGLNPSITNPNLIFPGQRVQVKEEISESTPAKGRVDMVEFFIQSGWRVTSEYGIRRDPFSGKNAFHRGIDFGGKPVGEPIQTPIAGMVMYAAHYDGWGNLVGIQDDNGYVHIFAHMDKVSVKVGAKVVASDVVGLNGVTGNATGPHLHYQINTPRGGIVGINAHCDPRMFR